jgi:hypothetical protein
VLAVGRQLKIAGGLPVGQLELRQRARLVFLLGLLLLLGLDPGVLDQLLLFILQELLAVGFARVALLHVHVGELRDFAAGERHDEQVVLAREGDRGLAPRPPRIRFRTSGPRDLAPGAVDRVHEHDVALIDEQHAPVGFVPGPVHRRCIAPLVVR